MSNEFHNPCGLDGFAFLEFAGDKALFQKLFMQLGFQCTASHKEQDLELYRQGNIQFIVNNEPDSHADQHAKTHGSGACAMGFKVNDSALAFKEAISRGAKPFQTQTSFSHPLLGIEGIGGSVIYFVDEKNTPFNEKWQFHPGLSTHQVGLETIDHLTHNVHQGNMDKWALFYKNIFNFRQIRYFNIEGKFTGLLSRALSSPCNKIRIPLNESKDNQSQIEEFLIDYRGEGIQHVALSTQNIYHTVPQLRENGVKFLDVPDTYYEMIVDRISWHQEPLDSLAKEKILIDGEADPKEGLLLQIFTENLFGPVFFEIIQRKGNQGFGEGNFQALFEAIERDQIKRGTLKVNA